MIWVILYRVTMYSRSCQTTLGDHRAETTICGAGETQDMTSLIILCTQLHNNTYQTASAITITRTAELQRLAIYPGPSATRHGRRGSAVYESMAVLFATVGRFRSPAAHVPGVCLGASVENNA